MAQYRRPPDPRDPESDLTRLRRRRLRQDSQEPIPWPWLGMGVLVTIAGILLAVGLASLLLAREPLSATLPTPTIIRLTAPPSAAPSTTPGLATATAIPTFTPPPTPDRSSPPDVITVGFYVEVVDTEGVGVSLRGGPSTDNIRLELVAEGEVMLVTGGPEEGNGFEWWQVRIEDGTEGWAAADFLAPVPEPQDGEDTGG
jgi:hypothetical protein